MNPSDFLKDLFNEKALRPLLKSVKEKLNEAIEATPSTFIARQIEEAFEQLKNPGAIFGDQFDASKIESVVDSVKAQLQKPTVSLVVAYALKEFAKRNDAGSLQSGLAGVLGNLGPQEQFIAQVVIAQLGQALNNLKTADATVVAAQLRTLAGSLPSSFVAQQITELLKNAPKALPQQPDLSQLPSPDAFADAALDVLKAASDALDKASKGSSLNETLDTLKQLPNTLNDIFTRLQPGNQNQPSAKKPVQKPQKKKGGFDL